MRIESTIKVTVKEKIIGGPRPLICLPLVAQHPSELLREAEQLIAFNPDLIEWRADHLAGHEDPTILGQTLAALRVEIGATPLLFTCRSEVEGGLCRLSSDKRLALNLAALAENPPELMDTELSNGAEFISRIRAACAKSDVKLILSYHNFTQTPEQNFLMARLAEAQDLGAQVAKIAVMPQNPGDVLALLNTAYAARTQKIKIPIVAISMGPLGALSRIAGGLFGSDVTFAVGRKSSAPGQIPIGDLRRHWEMMSI